MTTNFSTSFKMHREIFFKICRLSRSINTSMNYISSSYTIRWRSQLSTPKHLMGIPKLKSIVHILQSSMQKTSLSHPINEDSIGFKTSYVELNHFFLIYFRLLACIHHRYFFIFIKRMKKVLFCGWYGFPNDIPHTRMMRIPCNFFLN